MSNIIRLMIIDITLDDIDDDDDYPEDDPEVEILGNTANNDEGYDSFEDDEELIYDADEDNAADADNYNDDNGDGDDTNKFTVAEIIFFQEDDVIQPLTAAEEAAVTAAEEAAVTAAAKAAKKA